MNHIRACRLLASSVAAFTLCTASTVTHSAPQRVTAQLGKQSASRPLLLAHYMPWFEGKPIHTQWGWHWTMNHFNPDRVTEGRVEAASRYRPLIGVYDSSDPDALRCQAMLVKMSGIDGVIFDWYGRDDMYDYASINRNTLKMIPILEKAGLKFAICYEDQSVPKEIEAGKIAKADALAHGKQLLRWMETNFFSSSAYVKRNGRPVFLTFGESFYKDNEWNDIFAGLKVRPLYFAENDRRLPTASVGGYDWPAPTGGAVGAAHEREAFYSRAKTWPAFIPAAYPRFNDIYRDAGLGYGYPEIPDDNGMTYRATLTQALESRAQIVQLVTWNDWGEGTQIEPSVEFGYRDLETTRSLRAKYIGPAKYASADLRVPIQWYDLRKKLAGNKAALADLDRVFPLIVAERTSQAQAVLRKYGH